MVLIHKNSCCCVCIHAAHRDTFPQFWVSKLPLPASASSKYAPNQPPACRKSPMSELGNCSYTKALSVEILTPGSSWVPSRTSAVEEPVTQKFRISGFFLPELCLHSGKTQFQERQLSALLKADRRALMAVQEKWADLQTIIACRLTISLGWIYHTVAQICA